MRLLIDVGNSQINCAAVKNGVLKECCRINSNTKDLSEELLLGLLNCDINPLEIKEVAISTVVKELKEQLQKISIDIFNITPFFLDTDKTYNLVVDYKEITNLGSDRLAVSIAAAQLYPNQNILVIDIGTATTFELIDKKSVYLGGAIAPGLRISMEALHNYTSKLPLVDIKSDIKVCGKTTEGSIQSGLFFGHLGMIKEMINQYEKLISENLIVLVTGGYASLFKDYEIFTEIIDDLVLKGLSIAYDIINGEKNESNTIKI